MRNGWRMRTTTPAVDTPGQALIFAFRPIRRASVVANILREKFGPGTWRLTVAVFVCVY